MSFFSFGRSLAAATLVAALLHVGLPSVAAMGACPAQPDNFEKTYCEHVKDFNYYFLKFRIEFAYEKRIVFCPFTVQKDARYPPIRVSRDIEIVCAVKDKCTINGSGKHLEFKGGGAKGSISGFKFTGATKGAVSIHKSATRFEQTICDSTFEGNSGKKGSAIRTSRQSKLNVENSVFKNNGSKFGTIYTDGELKITESTFDNNRAKKDGSAIYGAGSSSIESKFNSFKNNRGGDVISLTFSEYEGQNNQYSNNGGTCVDGVFLRSQSACLDDKGGVGPQPTPPEPSPPTQTTTTTRPPSRPNNAPAPYGRPSPLPRGYFTYSNADNAYGPDAWENINPYYTEEFRYWIDLQQYLPAKLSENTCNSAKSFNGNRASPVELRTTEDDCKEFHQIRPKPGSISLDDNEVELQIRPNMLRISYDRRKDKKDLYPDVPTVDVPMGWGKFLDVVRVDFLCPAEHTINGEKFDCEIRIYVIQKDGRGVPVITVLAKVGQGPNAHNKHLQTALNGFDKVWRDHNNRCGGGPPGRERGLSGSESYTTHFNSTESRNLMGEGFDPFEFMAQTGSYHFYAYMGGLTEPPCSFFLHWRVMDTPIIISEAQLRQMKEMIWYHRDPNTCQYTSVHDEYGNWARPLQDSSRLMIHRCTCRDFLSDKQRKQTGMRTCPRGGESRWMPNPTDLTPHPNNLIVLGGREDGSP